MKTINLILALLIVSQMNSQVTPTCVATADPSLQSINCSPYAVQEVTLTAPMPGSVFYITSPSNGTTALTGNTVMYVPQGIGTYSYMVTNTVNACVYYGNFNTTSNSPFPSFQMNVSTFTIGCAPKNVATMTISNLVSSGPCSYTIIAPGSGTFLPGGSLSSNTTFSMMVGGTWTAVVRDNQSGCENRTPYSIIANTVVPTFSLSSYSSTLTCTNPTTQITAYSTSSFPCSYAWICSTNSVSVSSINVTTNTLQPNNTIMDILNLNVTNVENFCYSTTVVPIYQNIKMPEVSFSWPQILCNVPSIVVSPLTVDTSYQYVWIGGPATSSLSVVTSGTYTLSVTNPKSGCNKKESIRVGDCTEVGVEEYKTSATLIKTTYTDISGTQVEKLYFNTVYVKWEQYSNGSIRKSKFIVRN